MNGLIITTAYRFNDIYANNWRHNYERKPLMSKSKFFVNIEYSTPSDNWLFDFTFDYNGGGRIPLTNTLPAEYQMKQTFPGFVQLFGQITRRFNL